MSTERIRALNDRFRQEFPVSALGKFVTTRGIAALPSDEQAEIMHKVVHFDDFNEDNDPHGEHDFGSIEHNDTKIFWKIDYYDKNLEYASEDPSDSKVTTRVLTIMLAEEY